MALNLVLAVLRLATVLACAAGQHLEFVLFLPILPYKAPQPLISGHMHASQETAANLTNSACEQEEVQLMAELERPKRVAAWALIVLWPTSSSQRTSSNSCACVSQWRSSVTFD